MMDKNQPTNQQSQATDYGEPWHEVVWLSLKEPFKDVRGKEISARDGEQVAILHHAREPSFLHRIIACVNACAGIPSEDLTPPRVRRYIALEYGGTVNNTPLIKLGIECCYRCRWYKFRDSVHSGHRRCYKHKTWVYPIMYCDLFELEENLLYDQYR